MNVAVGDTYIPAVIRVDTVFVWNSQVTYYGYTINENSSGESMKKIAASTMVATTVTA